MPARRQSAVGTISAGVAVALGRHTFTSYEDAADDMPEQHPRVPFPAKPISVVDEDRRLFPSRQARINLPLYAETLEASVNMTRAFLFFPGMCTNVYELCLKLR